VERLGLATVSQRGAGERRKKDTEKGHAPSDVARLCKRPRWCCSFGHPKRWRLPIRGAIIGWGLDRRERTTYQRYRYTVHRPYKPAGTYVPMYAGRTLYTPPDGGAACEPPTQSSCRTGDMARNRMPSAHPRRRVCRSMEKYIELGGLIRTAEDVLHWLGISREASFCPSAGCSWRRSTAEGGWARPEESSG
jgi:hypothetical protein